METRLGQRAQIDTVSHWVKFSSCKMASAGNESFFEGTEKLLEVWFSSSTNDKEADLRVIDR